MNPPNDPISATKIVATVGPASEDRIRDLIQAGMSVARINFSHDEEADHRRRVAKIRRAAEEEGAAVGILGDIQGPKLRLGEFPEKKRELRVGECVRLIEGREPREAHDIPFNFEGLLRSAKPGHSIYLADAVVELVIDRVEAKAVYAEVVRGGWIGNRKGVHLPDAQLTFDVPTEQDIGHIELARELGLDMLGISFVSTGEQVEIVRRQAPGLRMVAKIERLGALENLDSIIAAADGLMVARGDLGVEVRLERLPLVQKRILQTALEAGKFTITATEMLESMVHTSRPTRAEVADVANAVLDGTDAVMLSAETAVGEHPVAAVRAAADIARTVEESQRFKDMQDFAFRKSEKTFSNATALAAADAARALGITKIVCFTESGNTVRLVSRYRSNTQIIALTPTRATLQSMTVLSQVRPLLCEREPSLEDMLQEAQTQLLERGWVEQGEEIVFVAGVPPGVSRSTNVMKLHRIGEASRLH